MKLFDVAYPKLEKDVLKRTAADLLAAGWNVQTEFNFVEKDRHSKFDILATKGSEVLVVEIAPPREMWSNHKTEQIERLKKIVEAHGWHFRLEVIANPLERRNELRDRIGALQIEYRNALNILNSSADQTIARSLRLMIGVLAWDLIKTALQISAELGSSGRSPIAIARQLVNQERLTDDAFRGIAWLEGLRNEFVHASAGFLTDHTFDVEKIKSVVQEVFDQLFAASK